MRAAAAASEQAASFLRLASFESQTLKIFYRAVRFALDGVAYERKKFSAEGRRGSIGTILRKMSTDFTDFKKRVEWWLGLFDCAGIIDWKAVPAPGTSVRCFAHKGERVDRRVTVDWGYHSGLSGHNAHAEGGRITAIADHYYAALNIARLHPLAAQHQQDRKRVDLIARWCVAHIEEFWRRDREWVRKVWGLQ